MDVIKGKHQQSKKKDTDSWELKNVADPDATIFELSSKEFLPMSVMLEDEFGETNCEELQSKILSFE